MRVVELGRAAFFGSEDGDLPTATTATVAADDRRPQFGYVGSRYEEARVLILGINPGNGPRDRRDPRDEVALPALSLFLESRTEASFTAAQEAYRSVCEGWPIWKRHCSEVIGAGGLSLDQIAYSNCLPWRTGSQSNFADAVAENAARLYVKPMIDDLRPSVVVALGKGAARVLALGGLLTNEVIVWNRAQAPTKPVLQERTAAAHRLFLRLGQSQT